MTPIHEVLGISEEHLGKLQDEAQEIYARVDKRRVNYHAKNLKSVFNFKRRDSDLNVILTVDRATSGRFYWDQKTMTLAFQYPSDLTSFALAFKPEEPITSW